MENEDLSLIPAKAHLRKLGMALGRWREAYLERTAYMASIRPGRDPFSKRTMETSEE